jgi:signal transducing adaptor molecule
LLNCAIVKATDENLTSENWELILEVCDKVDSKPDDGYVPDVAICLYVSSPRDAVAAVTKRFAHRNANVQLYSLTVCPAFRM